MTVTAARRKRQRLTRRQHIGLRIAAWPAFQASTINEIATVRNQGWCAVLAAQKSSRGEIAHVRSVELYHSLYKILRVVCNADPTTQDHFSMSRTELRPQAAVYTLILV